VARAHQHAAGACHAPAADLPTGAESHGKNSAGEVSVACREALGWSRGGLTTNIREGYQERNTVERCFNKLRQFRAMATASTSEPASTREP
jgi:hypothetical protein